VRCRPTARCSGRRLRAAAERVIVGRTGDVVNRTVKVSATGGWIFIIGAEFEVVDNGDSVQAVHGGRVAYVSSLRVGRPDVLIPAAQLRATAARSFRSGERFSHVAESVEGDAELFLDGAIWRLRGTMCASGTVATCMIDLPGFDEQEWAMSVWRSLRCDGNAA
jgi:hypothetical protein